MTVNDAKRAVFIYGREVSSLKGKDTRRKSVSINNVPKLELPRSIIDYHFKVFLAVYYMIIQGIPFMHSISNNTKFRTAESINGKKPYKKDILEAIGRVLNLYKTRISSKADQW